MTDGEQSADRQFASSEWCLIVAGVISGILGLVVFLRIHALWIAPIWEVAIIGAFLACRGGIVTARCYMLTPSGMRIRPLSWLATFGMVSLPLVPCVILTTLLPPLLESENGQLSHRINMPWLVTGFLVTLLIPAPVVGAILGWYLTKDRSTAALFAGMGLLIALGPGHNLPLFGIFGGATGPQLLKAYVLTFVPMAIAAIILAEATFLRHGEVLRAK